MAYYGRYSIAIRILLLKKYLEANAGRNRYVRPQEIHDYGFSECPFIVIFFNIIQTACLSFLSQIRHAV